MSGIIISNATYQALSEKDKKFIELITELQSAGFKFNNKTNDELVDSKKDEKKFLEILLAVKINVAFILLPIQNMIMDKNIDVERRTSFSI